MTNHIEHIVKNPKAKKLAQAGVIATGSHLGTKLIHKIAARPLLVFGIGLAAGIIWHQKKRQQQLAASETTETVAECCAGHEHDKNEE